MSAVPVPIGQKQPVSIPPVFDADGNPVPLDPKTPVTWYITARDGGPTTAAAIIPSADRLSATLVPVDALIGTVTVRVTAVAVADPSAGGGTLAFTAEANIIGKTVPEISELIIGEPSPK